MKILLAGDTHGNTKHVKYLISTALEQGCERIFQLGDFGYWEHETSGVRYLNEINKQARRSNIPIYFIDGNHDKTSLLLEKYKDAEDEEGFLLVRSHIRYAKRGHCWEWEGKQFIALGGAYSVDKAYRLWVEEQQKAPESLWFPEEEMNDRQLTAYLAGAPATVDIIFSHDKPRTSNPKWNRKDIPECWPNQNRIQEAVEILRPELLVHGHLHYRYEDFIPREGGRTKVVGLDADPQTAAYFYRVENSWEVLELEATR